MSAGAGTLLFSDLLEVLRRQGFAIGVDHYVRLHALAERVGADVDPRDLRTLLCPVVASSAAQQEQFYAAFDQLYGTYETALADRPRGDEPAEQAVAAASTAGAKAPRRVRRWIAIAAAVIVAIVAGVLWARTRASAPAGSAPPDTGLVVATDSAPPRTDSAGAPSTTPAGPAPERRFPYRTALLALPVLLFLAEELRRYRRRRLVLHRKRYQTPPFVWPIHLPKALNPYERAESLPLAARQLRRREIADGATRIDVERSVRATINALGLPTVRYVLVTRPVEYLILIERAAPRDHQARLFADLVQALEREGVAVTRYLFDVDPRVCYREPGEAGLLLSEVRRKHPSHRLIVMGGGEGLIDPIAGRLRSWAPALLSWDDRALLTTTPSGVWGMTEFELARHFLVLPASIEALGEVRGYFDDSSTGPDIASLPQTPPGLPPAAWRGEPEKVADRLSRHLGDADFQWLCACAIYPELQWELTLYLGSIAGGGGSLITDESLLRMIRLPWFRAGVIPDELRVVLLKRTRPELARAARAAIVGFLEHSPPPATSVAADSYQLNLAVQRLALRATDRKRRTELREAVERAPLTSVMQDQVLVQLLEQAPAAGALQLPARLRRFFFHHGVPAFGWSTMGRFAIAALALLSLGSFDVYRAWRERTPDVIVPEDSLSGHAPDTGTVPAAGPGIGSVVEPPGALAPPAAFRIVRTGVTQLERGDSLRLRARAGTTAPPNVQWRSTAPGVARLVDPMRGLVVGVKTGTATIEATSGSSRDSVWIRVVEPVLTTLELRGATALSPGQEATFDAAALSARRRLLPRPADLRFRSSRPDVLTIDPVTGAARAVGAGTVDVEVAGGGQRSKLTVTVGVARVAEDRWAPGLARLELHAPNARLTVNGVPVGATLWRADSMRPGEYRIAAAIDAAADCDAARAEVSVQLAASDQVRVISLAPVACGMLSASGPAGAQFVVASRDGKVQRRGTFPVDAPLVLPAGEYRVTAQMPRCSAFDEAAVVTVGQSTRVVISLACGTGAPDAARFQRDLTKAMDQYVAALRAGDTTTVARLFRATTREEARNRADLLELMRRREVRLGISGATATAAPGLTETMGSGDFRIQLTWRDAFGRNRRETATFRATLTLIGGEYQLTTCRVTGTPSLR